MNNKETGRKLRVLEDENQDKEIWRKVPGDYYSPSIHVTVSGGIGIDVGGLVIVLPVEKWHRFAFLAGELLMGLENER